MARIQVEGIEIDYEFVGDSTTRVAVITPGGRFAKETAGVPQLAQSLAEAGWRVVLWDRPNCGASDISFDGVSESALHSRVLVGLIHQLSLGPVALLGGSAGSRISLLAAAREPSLVATLVVWWITGGPISLAQLASYYCGESAMAAARGGMAAVADLPSWAEPLSRNSRNRSLLLAQDPDAFIARMQSWAAAYAYSDTSPVPGMTDHDFAKLTMPTHVFRSGRSDISHPRSISEWVYRLIPQSTLHEPPWPDQEWNDCLAIPVTAGRGRFERWPLLAPQLIGLLKS